MRNIYLNVQNTGTICWPGHILILLQLVGWIWQVQAVAPMSSYSWYVRRATDLTFQLSLTFLGTRCFPWCDHPCRFPGQVNWVTLGQLHDNQLWSQGPLISSAGKTIWAPWALASTAQEAWGHFRKDQFSYAFQHPTDDIQHFWSSNPNKPASFLAKLLIFCHGGGFMKGGISPHQNSQTSMKAFLSTAVMAKVK